MRAGRVRGAAPRALAGLRRAAVAACAAAALGGIGAVAQAQPAAPYGLDAKAVAVDNGRLFAGVKRVAITQLVVQFMDRQDGSAVAGSSRGGASAAAIVRLAGPGPEQYQRIVDALYDAAVAAAREAGLEVVPHEQLVAQPDFQKLLAAGKPSPVEDEKFTGHGGWTYSPRGLPVAWDSDDEESFMQSNRDPDPRGEQYRSGSSLLGGNTTAARWAEWGLAKALDAHLLKVRVTIPLAVIETSGGILSGGASVKITPKPRLARDVTRFTVRRENDAARVRLDQHLLLPADLMVLDKLSQQQDNTGGLVGALTRFAANTAKSEYRLSADPARYEAEVLAAARAAFARFGEVLKAQRAPS